MTTAVAELNRGMVIDVGVGESITILPSVDNGRIVVTMEAKYGRRARVRVQSENAVKIVTPEKTKP